MASKWSCTFWAWRANFLTCVFVLAFLNAFFFGKLSCYSTFSQYYCANDRLNCSIWLPINFMICLLVYVMFLFLIWSIETKKHHMKQIVAKQNAWLAIKCTPLKDVTQSAYQMQQRENVDVDGQVTRVRSQQTNRHIVSTILRDPGAVRGGGGGQEYSWLVLP